MADGTFTTERLGPIADLYKERFNYGTNRLKEIGSGLLGKIRETPYQNIDTYAATNPYADRQTVPSVYQGFDPTMLRNRMDNPTITDRTTDWLNRGVNANQGSIIMPTATGAGINTAAGTDDTSAMARRLGLKAWQPDQGNNVAYDYANLKQQWYQGREQAIGDAVAAVNNAYAGPLDELRKRLADYQVGDKDVQAAMRDYQADIESIAGTPLDPAEGLVDTGVVEEVDATYRGAEGALGAAFSKIDSNGNPGMSDALAEEMRTFEGVIEDSLRTDLSSLEELHGLSSQYAEALSQFAYSDDKYQAESERTMLKAQFDKAINDQKEAIAETERQMREAAALAAQQASDAYGDFNIDMATMQQESFMTYAAGKGMNTEEATAAWGVVQNIMTEYGASIATAADFRKYVNQFVNQGNFDKMGLSPLLQNYLNGDLTVPSHITDKAAQDAWIAAEQEQRLTTTTQLMNGNWSAAIRGDSTNANILIGQLNRIGIDGAALLQKAWNNPTEFDTVEDHTVVLDGWKIMKDTEDNWNDIQAKGNTFSQDQLSVAPSGYTFPVVGYNWGSGGGFGYVKPSGRTHQGVDIGGYRGSPIVSTANGTIESSGWGDSSGWYVRVRDVNGNLHKYMHLDQKVTLASGTKVSAGTQIGTLGRTGNASGGGPHLHYEVWNSSGKVMDPASWLKSTGGWNVSDPPSDLYRGYP